MPTRSARKSPKSETAPASLIEHLNECVGAALESVPDVGRRKMLVSFGWSVHERVFALVSRQGRIVVRLPDERAQRELSALEGAAPWKFSAKAAARDWLQLPEWMHEDAAQLRSWLTRAWELNRDAKPKRKAGPRKKPLRRTPLKTK